MELWNDIYVFIHRNYMLLLFENHFVGVGDEAAQSFAGYRIIVIRSKGHMSGEVNIHSNNDTKLHQRLNNDSV